MDTHDGTRLPLLQLHTGSLQHKLCQHLPSHDGLNELER